MNLEQAKQRGLINDHQMSNELKFKLDIQLFNDGEGEESNPNEEGNESGGEPEPPAKTFTQEELDDIIKDRIARERKKLQKEQSEAEKLATMTAEEKKAYEAKKKIKDLEAREMELNKRELRNEAVNTMIEKGLPKSLVDFLNFTDAESCNASIDTLSKAFNEAVEKGIEAKVKGPAPLKKAQGDKLFTQEEIAKMSAAEINANWDVIKSSMSRR